MRVSDKDLGFIIVNLSKYDSSLAYYKYQIHDDNIHPDSFSLVNSKSYSYTYPSQEDVDFFEENFKIVEIEKLETDAFSYSNKCNVWFEAEEEIIVYWMLKYFS